MTSTRFHVIVNLQNCATSNEIRIYIYIYILQGQVQDNATTVDSPYNFRSRLIIWRTRRNSSVNRWPSQICNTCPSPRYLAGTPIIEKSGSVCYVWNNTREICRCGAVFRDQIGARAIANGHSAWFTSRLLGFPFWWSSARDSASGDREEWAFGGRLCASRNECGPWTREAVRKKKPKAVGEKNRSPFSFVIVSPHLSNNVSTTTRKLYTF